MDETPVGTAQVEDPLGKVLFFTKLAETEPTERESIYWRSGLRFVTYVTCYDAFYINCEF